MALNRTILQKLNEKTINDKVMQEFLTDILNYETKSKSWYEKEYRKLIDKYSDKEV